MEETAISEVVCETTTTMPGHAITLGIPLIIILVLFLIFKYAAKMKWLTAISLAVVMSPLPVFFGLRSFGIERTTYETGYKVMLFLAIPFLVILLVPFFRWLGSSSGDRKAKVNSEERQRIVDMMEQGKISSAEGTELLDAMGRSNAFKGQDNFSRIDIAMLVAVALVVLGFFLPWHYLSRSMYQSGQNVGAQGWAILIIGVLVAVTVFVTPKEMLYKISMLQIFLVLMGLVLTILMMFKTEMFKTGDGGAGLFVCLAGFVLAGILSLMKFRKLAS